MHKLKDSEPEIASLLAEQVRLFFIIIRSVFQFSSYDTLTFSIYIQSIVSRQGDLNWL